MQSNAFSLPECLHQLEMELSMSGNACQDRCHWLVSCSAHRVGDEVAVGVAGAGPLVHAQHGARHVGPRHRARHVAALAAAVALAAPPLPLGALVRCLRRRNNRFRQVL